MAQRQRWLGYGTVDSYVSSSTMVSLHLLLLRRSLKTHLYKNNAHSIAFANCDARDFIPPRGQDRSLGRNDEVAPAAARTRRALIRLHVVNPVQVIAVNWTESLCHCTTTNVFLLRFASL